jgi:hypothetical protein
MGRTDRTACDPRRLPNAFSSLEFTADDRTLLVGEFRTTKAHTLGLETLEGRFHTLGQQRAFEFSEDRHQLEAGSPCRCRRIQTLLMQVKADPTSVKLRQELQQMLDRPTDPIDAPRGDQIEVLPDNPTEQAIKSWTLLAGLGPADPLVGEHLDNGPAEPRTDLIQSGYLVFNGLAYLADPGVKCDPHEKTLLYKESSTAFHVAPIRRETDVMPVGEVRELWNQKALADLQPEIDKAEEWAACVARGCL